MGLFPRKLFQWREPKAFVKQIDALERSKQHWWTRPLLTLVIAAVLVFLWFLARSNPENHPPSFSAALLIAMVGGAFGAYVLPWMISLCPSCIFVYDSQLSRIRGNTARQVKYADIESFSWGTQGEFQMLIIRLRNRKRDVRIGVPPDVPTDKVTQIFLAHQVQHEQTSDSADRP